MVSKIYGIILCVLGGAAGMWVFARLTSLAGKIHSWEPPFTDYETITIVGAVIAILFLIIGLLSLTTKEKLKENNLGQYTKIENVVKKVKLENSEEDKKEEEAKEKKKEEEDEKKKEAEEENKDDVLKEYYKKKEDDFFKY